MIAVLASRLGLAAVAIVAVGSVAFWIYREGKGAGRTDALETTIETQRSITDADARGPRTPDDVDRRLLDGTF